MEIVLNWLWQGIAVALAAAAAVRLMSPFRAETRYLALWIALAAVLVLPMASLVPAPIPGGESIAPHDIVDSTQTAPLIPMPTVWWTSGVALAVVWVLWCGVSLIRVVRSTLALRRARAVCRQFPSDLEGRLRCWSHVKARDRRTRLVVSDHVRSAAVFGWGSPLIAVSPTMIEQLDEAEIDRVVLHEWAHVQRRDDVAQIAVVGVKAMAGWHPAVGWLIRRLQLEREIACDEMAIGVSGSAKRYAESLIKLAGLPRNPGMASLPVIAADSSSGLERRLLRILTGGRAGRSRGSRAAGLAAGTGLTAIAMVISGIQAVGRTVDPPQPTALPSMPIASPPMTHEATTPMRQPAPEFVIVQSRATAPQRQPPDEPAGRVEEPHDNTVVLHSTPRTPVSSLLVHPQFSPVLAAGDVMGEPPLRPSQASVDSSASARPPTDSQIETDPTSPWRAAADSGVAIGRGSQRAAQATAGFFTRFARHIAGSF